MLNSIKLAAISLICLLFFGCASSGVGIVEYPHGTFEGNWKKRSPKVQPYFRVDKLPVSGKLKLKTGESFEGKFNWGGSPMNGTWTGTRGQILTMNPRDHLWYYGYQMHTFGGFGDTIEIKFADELRDSLQGDMTYPNGVIIKGYEASVTYKSPSRYSSESGAFTYFYIDRHVASPNGDTLYLHKSEENKNNKPTRVFYNWQGFYSLKGTIADQKLLQEQFREDSNIQVDFVKGSKIIISKQDPKGTAVWADWGKEIKYGLGRVIQGTYRGKKEYIKIFFSGEVEDNNTLKNGILVYSDGDVLYGDFELVKYHQGAEKFRGLKHKGEKVWGQMNLDNGTYLGEIRNDRPNGYGVYMGVGATPVEGLFADGKLKEDKTNVADAFKGVTPVKIAFYLAGFQDGKTLAQINKEAVEKEQAKIQQAKIAKAKRTERYKTGIKSEKALKILLSADPDLNRRFFNASVKVQTCQIFRKLLKEKLNSDECVYSKKTKQATRASRYGPRESKACVKAREKIKSRGSKDDDFLCDSAQAAFLSMDKFLSTEKNLKELDVFKLLENQYSRVGKSQVKRDYPYLDRDLNKITSNEEDQFALERRNKKLKEAEEKYAMEQEQKKALQDEYIDQILKEIPKGAPSSPGIVIPKTNSNPYYDTGVKRSQAYQNKQHPPLTVPHKQNRASNKVTKNSSGSGNTTHQAVARAPKSPSAEVKQVQPPYVQKSVEVVGVTPMAYDLETSIDLAQTKVLNYRDTACGTLNKSTVSWSAPICMRAEGSETMFFCKQSAAISCWSDFCNDVTDLCAEGSRKTIKRTHVEVKNPKGFEIISAPSLTILK